MCVRARRVRPDPYATPHRPGHHPRHPYTLAPAAHRSLSNVAVLTASATRSDLPPAVLHVQLELLHLQLLAWTSGKYERVLMHNPALDTSAALAGTEASFEALVKRMDSVMDYVLQAVETLRMRPIVRGAAEASLRQVTSWIVAQPPVPLVPATFVRFASSVYRGVVLSKCCGVQLNSCAALKVYGTANWLPGMLAATRPFICYSET